MDPGFVGPPAPSVAGVLACAQLDVDFPVAFVPAFAPVLAVSFVSVTGHVAISATMSLDIFVSPSPIGEGVFRLVVDGIVLPPLVSAEESTAIGVNDHCIALSGCTDVTPGIPHTVELQWMSGTADTTLALEPVAENDEEHATIIVMDVPPAVPPP